MQGIWNIKNSDTLSEKSIVERLLEVRGITSSKKTKDFLDPLNMSFTSPYVFNDMEKCIKRIVQAIENQEKIVVWGDFDADGVTSTCLMFKTLQHVGANVEYYIPSRQNENHGLNSKSLINLLSKQKAKLFITVDCASSDLKEISLAKSLGADVIITDHHEVDEISDDIVGILNPKACGNLSENLSIEEIEYLTNFAGVGVAFKLAFALLEKYDKKEFVDELLPLVTLGTIADIVPLIGENRAFILKGLKLIQEGKNKGISTLLKSINYKYEINSECVAFYIAPRINASGRVDTAQIAFNLLYENNNEKLEKYANDLNKYNLERQEMCNEIYLQAIDMIKQDDDFENNSAIVLYNSNWHIGVIGIVASKLVEKFYKPAFLMTKKENLICCSARGIEEIDIHEIISNISDMTESGGGHKMAGGFAFDSQKITFDVIKAEINQIVEEMTEGIELIPHMNIDLKILPQELNFDLSDELKKLEPFGTSNPQPVFCCENLNLIDAKLMGQDNNHLKIKCKFENEIIDGVFWNNNQIPTPKDGLVNVAFNFKINEFNGEKKIQLDLKDINYEKTQVLKFIDQRNKENFMDMLEEYCCENGDKIKVYAYKNETLKKLNNYPKISENILTKAKMAPQIVFLDYPKSLKKMQIIIEKTNPQTVHLCSSKVQKYTPDEYFKTLSGLLKYSLNKKNGDLNLSDLSNYFTYDEELITKSLELFKKAKMIDYDDCKILNIKPVELAELKKFDEYKSICASLEKNNNFLYKLSDGSIKELEKVLNE